MLAVDAEPSDARREKRTCDEEEEEEEEEEEGLTGEEDIQSVDTEKGGKTARTASSEQRDKR